MLTDAVKFRKFVERRSFIGGSDARIIMGSDDYESETGALAATAAGQPMLGIGVGTAIEGAIIDKNARIGDNVMIINSRGYEHHDGENFFVRDKIVVIPKSAVVQNGTII